MELTTKDIPVSDFIFKRYDIKDRNDVVPAITEIYKSLSRVSKPLVLVDFGATEGGLVARVGTTSANTFDMEGYESVRLEATRVLSALHEGDYANIRDTYMRMYALIRERGLVPQTNSREVVHHFDPDSPEDTVVEIQWPIHDWTGLLAQGIEETLGPEARDHVMEGAEALTLETARDERLEWVKAALLRLDGIADEEQKYWAVSPCADCYPVWRIEKLRQVYMDTGSVDKVLEEMKGDTEWYSTPYREGNLIYHTKVPYDREAWEAATDKEARRRVYCHCALVQDRIDEVSPTYCYCGTGWVRQVWEGVLETPIRVEVLKSLPAGDDECQFLIHLPEEVVD